MPLPSSLVASIVSAVIETVVQSATSSTVDTAQYQSYLASRKLPPEAKLGVMQPPQGFGQVSINDKTLQLSPAAQFRNQQNLIIVPMTIQHPSDVVYVNDDKGAVYRIWLISKAEASSLTN